MEPQRLKSGQGWQWIKQGYTLFMKAPLLWVVVVAICVIAAVALSSIPVAGEALVTLLMPVVLIGLMAGCRALLKGEELELAHLFTGFQRHTAQLVTLGGFSLVGQLLILGVMMLMGGGELANILMNGPPSQDPEIMQQAAAGAGMAILVGITLFSILLMALQFAPMLVFFNDVKPVAAMKLSLRGFLRNVGPMLVYGITLMLFGILASIPAFLGWLILLPIIFTSLYASYIGIFPAGMDNAVLESAALSSDDQMRT